MIRSEVQGIRLKAKFPKLFVCCLSVRSFVRLFVRSFACVVLFPFAMFVLLSFVFVLFCILFCVVMFHSILLFSFVLA